MENPWFELDPNDWDSRWWLRSDIIDEESALKERKDENIKCHLILQDHNLCGEFYRFSTWYNDDPNRYYSIRYDIIDIIGKPLHHLLDNEIVNYRGLNFRVYTCKFGSFEQRIYCKIFLRIE